MADVDYSEMYLVPKDIYDRIMKSIEPEEGGMFFLIQEILVKFTIKKIPRMITM